ncbi:hypothetical protein HK101_002943, partial [Irineochytrium annulatum]
MDHIGPAGASDTSSGAASSLYEDVPAGDPLSSSRRPTPSVLTNRMTSSTSVPRSPDPPPRSSTLTRFQSAINGEKRPSIVRSIFASTALAAEQMEREREAGLNRQPPLNLLTTTPWNLTRMVIRLGPVVNGLGVADNILDWNPPFRTGILMAAFVIM